MIQADMYLAKQERNWSGLPLRQVSVQGVLHCESEGYVNILRWETHS